MKFFPIFVIPATLAFVAAGTPSEFVVQHQDVTTQERGNPDASAALVPTMPPDVFEPLFHHSEESNDDSNVERSSGVQPSPQVIPTSTAVGVQGVNNTAGSNDALHAQLDQFAQAVLTVRGQIEDMELLLAEAPTDPILTTMIEELSQSFLGLKATSQAVYTLYPDSTELAELSDSIQVMETVLGSTTPANIEESLVSIKLTWESIKVGIRNVISHFAPRQVPNQSEEPGAGIETSTTREAGSGGDRPTRKLLEFLE